MKFDAVQAWIDNVAYSHSKSANTEYNYRRWLDRFCNFIEKSPKEILEEYEHSNDREFKRKYAKYVRAFISQLSRNGYAVGSVRAVVAALKSFFKYNDLPLGHVPVARIKITFHNRDITKEEIIKILQVSKPRDRAFYCMMSQTGLRPDTLCSLELRNVEPEFSKEIVPCKVEVPEEIAKGEFGAYFTFMGEESIRFLKSYLATRPDIEPDDYLFTSYGSDKRAHPKSITRIFAKTIDKLKKKGIMDFKDRQHHKPAEIRLYNLRKYFRRKATKAGIEYVNFWMGHKVNYEAPFIPASDEHYFSREDVKFQRQLYEKEAMPELRLETATPSETDLVIQRQAKEIEDLKEELSKFKNTMRQEMDRLRVRYQYQYRLIPTGEQLTDEEVDKILEGERRATKLKKEGYVEE